MGIERNALERNKLERNKKLARGFVAALDRADGPGPSHASRGSGS